MVFLQPLQVQIPTAARRTEVFAQKGLRDISIRYIDRVELHLREIVPLVAGVLGDLKSLRLFTEGGTVSGLQSCQHPGEEECGKAALTPYLPVIPTLVVRLAIVTVGNAGASV